MVENMNERLEEIVSFIGLQVQNEMRDFVTTHTDPKCKIENKSTFSIKKSNIRFLFFNRFSRLPISRSMEHVSWYKKYKKSLEKRNELWRGG